jgi:ubiquinone/menaquinone biosynthesis C-methylase UbiE
MRRLVGGHEHLDGELLDVSTLAGNLRDLARVNYWLGGLRLSSRAVERLLAARSGTSTAPTASAGPIRLLDVGTGAADIPVGLLQEWRRAARQPELEITATDRRPEIIALANKLTAASGEAGLRLMVADGLALPFDDGAFDIVHASMVLHHLEPADGVRLLREMGRVARLGIVVNDLDRGWLPWIGAQTLFRVFTRNPFTRHDGPLSVRRAYRAAEARALAVEAGLRVIGEERLPLGFRWAIVAVAR